MVVSRGKSLQGSLPQPQKANFSRAVLLDSGLVCYGSVGKRDVCGWRKHCPVTFGREKSEFPHSGWTSGLEAVRPTSWAVSLIMSGCDLEPELLLLKGV